MSSHLSRRPAAALVVGALLLPLASVLTGGPAAAVVTECSGKPQDINGDGFADIAIGESNGGPTGGGRLHVFYGTASGPATSATGDAPDDQLFAQGAGGIGGQDTAGDQFGSTVVVSDLNADGCADVAVAAQGNARSTGAVVVLWGSITGLTGVGSQFLDQNDGVPGSARTGELFASALAAGDFDGDGVNDLAAGAPDDVDAAGDRSGAVTVFYGSRSGFGASGRPAAVLTQDLATVAGGAEAGDGFGLALAAGDVTGDGVDDLVVGVPGENGNAGIVQSLPGGPGGLGAVAGSTWSQNTVNIPTAAEANDFFGWALAVGDVTGDGVDDVVVGAPGENRSRGVVNQFVSTSESGALVGSAASYYQDIIGVDGTAEAGELFGYSVALGRLDGDRFLDAVVGTPRDTVAGKLRAGSVTLLRGASLGLGRSQFGGVLFSQNTGGVPGAPERDDQFGFAVSTAAVTGGATDNVLVGAPGEALGGVAFAGQSTMLAATATGPSGTASRALNANTPGVRGVPRTEAFWGIAID